MASFINLDHVVKITTFGDGKCEFVVSDGTSRQSARKPAT